MRAPLRRWHDAAVRRSRPIPALPAAVLAVLAVALGPLAAGATSQQEPQHAPQQGPATARFVDRTRSFALDLPADWRQVAPTESRQLAAKYEDLPVNLTRNEPVFCYPVGPVDRWLGGTFDGAYLYVVEQDNEWQLDDAFASRLQEMWRAKGEADATRYELEDVRRVAMATSGDDVVTCVRTSIPANGRAQRSIDVYAPTGGRQLSLAFTCWRDDFPAWEERFRAMIASATFARPARGEQTIGDRLWSPLVTGAAVGLVLLVLYRHSRQRRYPVQAPPR